MRKYVILPYNIYERLNKKENNILPITNVTTKENEVNEIVLTDVHKPIELELQQIITDKVTNIDEKRLLYTQILQKLIEQLKTPSNTSTFVRETNFSNSDSENKNASASIEKDDKKLLDVAESLINKTFSQQSKTKGLGILEFLHNAPDFTWNENLEVQINTINIPDSNLIDVIDFCVKNYTKKDPPIGFNIIQNWLKKAKIPKFLIKNSKVIQSLKSSLEESTYTRTQTWKSF